MATPHQNAFYNFCRWILEDPANHHLIPSVMSMTIPLGAVAKASDPTKAIHPLLALQKGAEPLLRAASQSGAMNQIPDGLNILAIALRQPHEAYRIAREVHPVICTFPGDMRLPRT
ncbi:hypothetical protein GF380_03310 [Candidatus Uhrbacteria bacterium]|nr:hypothetical protein [Candidatus Uhrbacteria bacterium]MBD3284163.1 hypothetical protein [Candidatus Uhrbacteria bacterium]